LIKVLLKTVEAIKQLLEKYHVNEDGRIIIDFKNLLVTECGEGGISDVMGIRGTISGERAREWLKDIERVGRRQNSLQQNLSIS